MVLEHWYFVDYMWQEVLITQRICWLEGDFHSGLDAGRCYLSRIIDEIIKRLLNCLLCQFDEHYISSCRTGVKWDFSRSVPVLNNPNQSQPCVQQHSTYPHESWSVGVRTTRLFKRPNFLFFNCRSDNKTIQSIDIIVYLLYLKCFTVCLCCTSCIITNLMLFIETGNIYIILCSVVE